jgi:hypothetical protein
VDDRTELNRLAAAAVSATPLRGGSEVNENVLETEDDEGEENDRDDEGEENDRDDDESEEDDDDYDFDETPYKRARKAAAAKKRRNKTKKVASLAESDQQEPGNFKASSGVGTSNALKSFRKKIVRAEQPPGDQSEFDPTKRVDEQLFKYSYSFETEGDIASVSLSLAALEFLHERYVHMCGLRISLEDKRNSRLAKFWAHQCEDEQLRSLCKQAHEGVQVIFDQYDGKKTLNKICVLCNEVISGPFFCHGFKNDDEDDICESHFYHVGCGAFLVLCKSEDSFKRFCCLGMARGSSSAVKYGKATRCKPTPNKDSLTAA